MAGAERSVQFPKSRLEQLVESDRQIAHSLTASVEDSVRDCRADSGYADFSDASGTHGSVWVGNIRPDHVNLGDVHVHRHMILSQTRIHDATVALIKLRLLHHRQTE